MNKNKAEPLIQTEKIDQFVYFALFFFGMSGLIGWNAIISSLDLFEYYHKKYSPSFLIPFISNFVNLICQFLIIYHNKTLSYKSILVFTVSLSMTLIVLCPFSVIFIEGLLGFCITMILIVIQSASNAFASSTFFSVISYFPKEYIIIFSTGQGGSGLIINIIRYIILFSVNIEDEKTRVITTAIIFYSVSGLLLIITIILIFEWLINSGEFEKERLSIIPKETGLYENNSNIDNKGELVNGEDSSSGLTDRKKASTGFDFKRMIEVIKKILDFNLTLCGLYLVSYTVYPGFIYDIPLFGMPTKYLNNTQTFIYNLSSLTGRQLTRLLKIEKKTFIIITCFRVIFLVTFPLVFFFQEKKYFNVFALSIFLLFNLMLCAGTNGFLATIAYYLAPKNVDEIQKGVCGGSLVLFQGMGLLLGSTIASFGMQYLKDYIKQ